MKTQDSPTHPRRCARGPAGLGLLALKAVVWGPQGFTDKQPGPPEPVTAEFPNRSQPSHRPSPGLSPLQVPTFPIPLGRRGRGMDDGVRLAAEGTRGVWWGAVYGAHNGGNPRRSSQDCLHHHLSHLSPQRLLRLSEEAGSWADPPRPAYATSRAGDTSP